MGRITVKDVRIMFGRAVQAGARLGLDTSGWTLQEGGAYRPYRLFQTRPGSSGLWMTGLGVDNLGSTAREAYQALLWLAAAWEAAPSAWTVSDRWPCELPGHPHEHQPHPERPSESHSQP